MNACRPQRYRPEKNPSETMAEDSRRRPRRVPCASIQLTCDQSARLLFTQVIIFACWFMLGAAHAAAEDPPPVAAVVVSQVSWHKVLSTAYRDALTHKRPILVRVGRESCPWCKQLEAEIAQPALQAELSRWTLVHIDVEKAPNELRTLGIGPVPALRVLSPRGRLLKSHDGFLATDDLLKWLQQGFTEASETPDELLLAEGEPSLLEVIRLVRQFDNRDATVREAAIRRLLPFPKTTGLAVVKSFHEGSLAAKLATYEILQQWRAPLEGLDPWQSDTFTPERLTKLDQWLSDLDPTTSVSPPETLTEEDLQSLRTDIDRMLSADEVEAAATRERIARFGKAALPEVVSRLQEIAADHDRQRLLTLRYRLVSGGTIVLTWPGGLQRLADSDPQVRHEAAEELASNATEDLQPLLLELFSDPDPLVRELSLRGLQNVGGKQATAALVSLLNDPEPNVRAAVLKQLSEDASADMIGEIAQYVKQESDADLVVHGVRYFRAVRDKRTIPSLLTLLEHDSWQVRAETAEAIAEVMERASYSSDFAAGNEISHVYDALLKRLEDPDAFVVSRVLSALRQVDAERAVEPLVQAATKHPQLATQIVVILAQGSHMREKAIPHLRAFFTHDDPVLQAAAVHGLCDADPEHVQDIVLTAFANQHKDVRIAAATSLLTILDRTHPSQQRSGTSYSSSSVDFFGGPMDPLGPTVSRSSGNGIASRLLQGALKIFSSGGPPDSVAPPAAAPPMETPAEETLRDEIAAPVTPAEANPTEVGDNPSEASGTSADQPDDQSKLDAWLAELYAGKHRAAWMTEMVEPLHGMLQAESPDERHAAALALLPLGGASESLPVLLAAVRTDTKLLERSSEALKWLPAGGRSELFWTLLDAAPNDKTQGALVGALSTVNDPRDAEVFWKLLEREEVSGELLQALEYALRQSCFGERYYDLSSITPRQRKEALAAIEPHVGTGPAAKRLVAILLLAPVAAERAIEETRRLMNDRSVSDGLRLDAFQILLLTHTAADRTQQAIDALSDPDPRRQKIALTFLALGTQSLATLTGSGLDLTFALLGDEYFSSHSFGDEGKIIIPEPPRLLEAKHVRPLLISTNPESAAYAGYLLTLLGEPDGLAPLLRHWRTQKENSRLNRLVYRAIAVLDDPQYMPILREIYSRLKAESDVDEFYWTIRIMSGPEILQFRKRLRKEVGMPNLQ